MEKEKRPAAKRRAQPADIKKALQNSTRGLKKSRTARESHLYLTNDLRRDDKH